MSALIGKGRKPKFELHLKIYDLNNVPLVSGSSFIKWHLPHSMNAEHRGRTAKCQIANHKVEYAFAKVVPAVRMSTDRNSNLNECPIELEIVQEFALSEKITLGNVRLNLAEYVEESESFMREIASPPPSRRRNNSVVVSPTSVAGGKLSGESHRDPEDGIVRRYLMQDSKVNSTLKIGILLIQVDGERNFIAPPLKTAPVFGGIAGFMAPDQVEDDTGMTLPTTSKNREAAEVQDLYRRTLAASWSRQPSELPADECIEDIFSGGNGWKTRAIHHNTTPPNATAANSADTDEDSEDHLNQGTLRPSDFRRMVLHHRRTNSHSSASNVRPSSSHNNGNGNGNHHHHSHFHFHRRTHSGSSDKSVSTITGGYNNRGSPHKKAVRILREDSRESTFREEDIVSTRSVASMASLAPTLGSSERERAELGMKRAKEVEEFDVRDDLVAWRLPGGIVA